ncbi:hypothetical protein GCM10008941_34820 [Rhizomicrobium palustre]
MTAAALLAAAPAGAAVPALTVDLDPATLTVGGIAYGALFAPDLPKATGGADQRWATGAADVNLKLSRDYDSGLSLSLKSSFEVLRDRLSYDNYGGALVQKVYGVAQTGLGTVEVGMTDGAVYALAITGPVSDDITSIENPNATFFIDPSTGRAFGQLFDFSSATNSSLNYAKISYYTPRILGFELGASYTPAQNREVIPFLNNGPHKENRQKSIWEVALSYSEQWETMALGVYGGVALAHGDGKLAEDASLTDWSVGSEFDYTINDDWKWAIGGGYRRANTFAFDIYDARTSGATESGHLSSTLSYGDYSLTGEYGRGTADGGMAGPVIGIKAWQVQLGYTIDTNWQLTTGWQEHVYDRNLGSFYDGSKRLAMSAAFVHLKFKVGG